MWDWLFLRWRLRQKANPASSAIKPPAPAGSIGFSINSSIIPGSTGSGTGTAATLGLTGAEATADAGVAGADDADAGAAGWGAAGLEAGVETATAGTAATGTAGSDAGSDFGWDATAAGAGGGVAPVDPPSFVRSLMFLVSSAARVAASLSARSLATRKTPWSKGSMKKGLDRSFGKRQLIRRNRGGLFVFNLSVN